jgi:hypothetical protein
MSISSATIYDSFTCNDLLFTPTDLTFPIFDTDLTDYYVLTTPLSSNLIHTKTIKV